MRIVLQTLMVKITSSQEDTKRDIKTAKREQDALMETMMANLTSGMANITSEINEQNENLKQEIASSKENTRHEITNLVGKIDATRSELTEHISGVSASFETKLGSMQQELATVNKEVMLTREEVARTTADLGELETRVKTLEIRPESQVNPGYVNDDPDILRCLKFSLKSTAQYWPEVVKNSFTTYSEFRSKFLEQFWNKKIQGNLRAKLHTERFYPGKGKKLEEHLSEVYDKSKQLTPPVSDEEFAAMILHQLPNKYQTHWSGRLDHDLASFREGLLEFDRIERLQRSQFNRDGDENNQANKPPPL
ncbi:hypothetical protein PR048_011871 [Dryococelus australis]|uniref:Retrotransposon gag domain-containing protein n=1 Tax=Dryococelus australis TaxID=614101 RepID=A0ABQ9HMU8_9NEOP|nr:hypothetical protein PR048_011871 [Dryococelus australis]